MNTLMLTPTGLSRAVLPCGVEVIRKVGFVTDDRAVSRHTVIVAGQHGSEIGPVLALLARGVSDLGLNHIDFGAVTIVRCANPYGFALGQRFDLDGLDPNRGWTRERVEAPWSSMQQQVWNAIAFADFDELLVLDLHTSGIAGGLARKVVCVDDVGRETAVDLATTLLASDETVGLDPRDATWDVLDQKQTTDSKVADRKHEHPTGTLASWASANGGVGFTVEFAEHTHRPQPAGYDGLVGVNPSSGWRTMTIGERVHGVGTLLSWVINRHRLS